ncbi:MAG TPA: hypothetical protein VKZ49_12085 [Polyangiaceae bacterium]|nr:hypothetical protein [Polyangiaceae bacterium]
MNLVGALVTGLLLLAGHLGAAAVEPTTASRVQAGLLSPMLQAVERLSPRLWVEPTRAGAPPRLDETPPPFVKIATRGRTIMIPSDCRFAGRYDLLIHFHGATSTMEPLLERSGLYAVFVVLNLGNGSGAYEDRFAGPAAFDGLLAAVDARVKEHCHLEQPAADRIALSAWSAGYGAIWKILARERDAQRIDAVLLADGLHAGFEPGHRGQVNGLQMQPFTLFSYEAAAGERLMAITHSHIVPPGYASTTQTADHLLYANGLERQTVSLAYSRKGMVATSRAERGGFFVEGFEGQDARAHCDHLYGLGETLLPLLEQRWRE